MNSFRSLSRDCDIQSAPKHSHKSSIPVNIVESSSLIRGICIGSTLNPSNDLPFLADMFSVSAAICPKNIYEAFYPSILLVR
jgi:hypothetical protein